MPSGAAIPESAIGVHQRCAGQSQAQPHPPQSQRQLWQQQTHHTHQPPQPQQQQQQQQQQQVSQQNDVSNAYRYLLRHCVHSKVEEIFNRVLAERPEDPLQYIVEYLRNNSNKSPGKEQATDGENSTSPARNRKETQETTEAVAPVQSEVVIEEPSDDHKQSSKNVNAVLPEKQEVVEKKRAGEGGEEKVVNDEEEETQGSSPKNTVATLGLSNETPAHNELELWAFPSGHINNATVTPLTEAYTQTLHTSLCNTRTNVCVMRPSSSLLAPWTTASVRNSRCEASHTLTSFRFGSTVCDTVHSSVASTALDRDDSTRSDLSAFSLASVDIQDFLQEFRSAKADCVGVETRLVDLEMLSEILQCVNIPLPDIPLIAELFDDVKRISALRYNSTPLSSTEEEKSKDATAVMSLPPAATSSTGTEADGGECVYFDAFLARMAYMIHGRYPTEVIRGTFYSVLESVAPKKCPADDLAQQQESQNQQLQQQQQQQKGTDDETRRTSSSSASVVNKSLHPASALTPGPSVTHTYPGVPRAKSAPRAAANDVQPAAEPSTLLRGVPLRACVEEGLWHGLGIPASRPDVAATLLLLGVPAGEADELHVNDFVRLVAALTGQSVLHSGAERASPWMMSSFGRDGSLVPPSGSCKEDGK